MAANDFFTLEALNAKHGDALLLHYGTKNDPRHILIDGGPTGVYKTFLKPRLENLAKAHKERPALLEHVFVTHLDSDHIRGVLDLALDMQGGNPPAKTSSFWFNTFDDAMTELPEETRAQVNRTGGTASLASISAVVASVAEGQSLRNTVKELPAMVNGGTGKLLMADKKGVRLNVSDHLTVTLVCPSREHLRKLAEDWKKKAKPTKAQTAAYLDRSVYNLSSLVMVVEAEDRKNNKRRMLLTGDARGDHILSGLEYAGFLDQNGPTHFDIFKVSHHGSDRDYEEVFFQRVTANHYVISADGRHENPSKDLLVWIGMNAPATSKIYLTNRSGTGFGALEENLAAAEAKVPELKKMLIFRPADSLSVRVDLLDNTSF